MFLIRFPCEPLPVLLHCCFMEVWITGCRMGHYQGDHHNGCDTFVSLREFLIIIIMITCIIISPIPRNHRRRPADRPWRSVSAPLRTSLSVINSTLLFSLVFSLHFTVPILETAPEPLNTKQQEAQEGHATGRRLPRGHTQDWRYLCFPDIYIRIYKKLKKQADFKPRQTQSFWTHPVAGAALRGAKLVPLQGDTSLPLRQ